MNKLDLSMLVMNESLIAKNLSCDALVSYFCRRCAAASFLKTADMSTWFDSQVLARFAHDANVVLTARGQVTHDDPVEAIRSFLITLEMDEAVLAESRLLAAYIFEYLTSTATNPHQRSHS